jgi:Xaa-Pro aminopeptidase
MRKSIYNIQMFKDRRGHLKNQMMGSALILHSHPEYIRNNDVHHPYRQDSNFFYLTGFEEPESIFIFRPGMTPETILFVRPKDQERETWNGFRYGPTGAQSEFQIDQCYLISEFEKMATELLKPVEKVYHQWGINSDFDKQVLEVLDSVRSSHGRSGRGVLPVFDARELLGEVRLRKTKEELVNIRQACEISAEAHCELMRFTKPGVNENQLHGVFIGTSMLLGAQREGYGSIVASGNNATTLHYVFNDHECKDGDLLLIDAGAEYRYYTGDITRDLPVNGHFSAAQKAIYGGILEIQKKIIEMVKPGLAFQRMQEASIEMLTDLMIDLKLLKGKRADLIQNLDFKKYYMHGVSHYLGMDVHDAGQYMLKGEPRKIETNFLFTIEPGLYIPAHDQSAPKEFRGIGVRIEDNILVTDTGFENLTIKAPKEMADVEAMMAQVPKYFKV